MALSRQNLPTLRTSHREDNPCAKGAYVLAEADGKRALTLLSTGSEVHLAVAARTKLQAAGVPTAVVSMPCLELFEQQDQSYRDQVLGAAPRLAIEAGIEMGWTRYVGSPENMVGLSNFGASGPAQALYQHFGLTEEAIVAKGQALARRKAAA